MLPCLALIFCHYFVWPSGNCTRIKTGEFFQLHFSKKICLNSKQKPSTTSKQDELHDRGFSCQMCVVCVNYHSAVSDPHRFIVREYSYDLEEQMHEETKQLAVHKKEQYVSGASCVFFMCVLHVLWCVINVCASSTGSLCALAEDEFQSGVCCLDSLESIEGVCGISPQVRSDNIFSHFSLNVNDKRVSGLIMLSPAQVRVTCRLSSFSAADWQEALEETQKRTLLTVHASGPHCHCQQDRSKRVTLLLCSYFI